MELWGLPLIFRCEIETVSKKGFGVEQSGQMQVLYLLKIKPISPGKISLLFSSRSLWHFIIFTSCEPSVGTNALLTELCSMLQLQMLSSDYSGIRFPCIRHFQLSIYWNWSILALSGNSPNAHAQFPLHYFTLVKTEDKTIPSLISVCKEDTEMKWRFWNFFVLAHNVEVTRPMLDEHMQHSQTSGGEGCAPGSRAHRKSVTGLPAKAAETQKGFPESPVK